jgi:hypothetical protein
LSPAQKALAIKYLGEIPWERGHPEVRRSKRGCFPGNPLGARASCPQMDAKNAGRMPALPGNSNFLHQIQFFSKLELKISVFQIVSPNPLGISTFPFP